MKIKKIIIPLLIIIFAYFLIKNVYAQFFDTNFDPNFIISDFELQDYTSMDLYDIQYFLDQNNGILKKYYVKNPSNNKILSAAEIIRNASIEYKINPQYILTLLQKEQSLITDPSPSQKQLDWATGFAICDSCDMDDPLVAKYKGIYNQIYYAAKRNRFYIDNYKNTWLFQKNNIYNIDNRLVVPKNQATVNLYNYTPHINGNYNFWKIWQKWFTKKYPDGSIVKEYDSPTVWLIDEGKRKAFTSWSTFLSRYKASSIMIINHNDLLKYSIGSSIQFENYSYLRDPDKNIYLLDNDRLRKFESREVARFFGVNPEEVIDITWQDYNYYDKGEDITMKSTYPSGAILADKINNQIYYVKNGFKYPILDDNILITNFSNQIKTYVDSLELSKLETGNPIKFVDGTLIKDKNNPKVFIISNGELHQILNEEVFKKFGYKWTDIINVSKSIIDQYQVSDPIQIKPDQINTNELLPDQNQSKPL